MASDLGYFARWVGGGQPEKSTSGGQGGHNGEGPSNANNNQGGGNIGPEEREDNNGHGGSGGDPMDTENGQGGGNPVPNAGGANQQNNANQNNANQNNANQNNANQNNDNQNEAFRRNMKYLFIYIYMNNRDQSRREQDLQAQMDQEIPVVGGFVPGYLLRFAPMNVRVRIDPDKGWDYEGDSPEEPPAKAEPPTRITQSKVGHTIDGTKPKVLRDRQTGGITEIHNDNEQVYIRVTTRAPGYEFCDSLGRHIKNKVIRFDRGFGTKESIYIYIVEEAARLTRRYKDWKSAISVERQMTIQGWRTRARDWEVAFLQREWFINKDTEIFPPDCSEVSELAYTSINMIQWSPGLFEKRSKTGTTPPLPSYQMMITIETQS
ncbi:hypothetical protein FQN54_005081 [Arachnomyces sp. PD_36]|nr:hypothetical protein FQN54_005081 [Arachnomyces sp. PD_36]